VSILLQVTYLALFAFLYALLGRMIMTAVMVYGRRWRPGRGAAAALEVVWSVTDPPLKALRRLIPPIRVGAVSFDLAGLVLLVIVFVLMSFVLSPLINFFSA
jgi:YggT family protein